MKTITYDETQWKLVPMEQCTASREAFDALVDDGFYGPYALGTELWERWERVMLAAAPTPPADRQTQPNTNAGHGHVFPRPDGAKARCGGPALCVECSRDFVRWQGVHHV